MAKLDVRGPDLDVRAPRGVDPSLYIQRGKAIGKLAESVAEAGQTIYQRETELNLETMSGRLSQDLQNAANYLDENPVIGAGELNAMGIKVDPTHFEQSATGEQVVQTWKIADEIYAQKAQEALDTNLLDATTADAANELSRRFRETIPKQQQAITEMQIKQRREMAEAEFKSTLTGNMDNGRYDLARSNLDMGVRNGLISPVQAQDLLREVAVEEENAPGLEAMANVDAPGYEGIEAKAMVAAELERLRNYDNPSALGKGVARLNKIRELNRALASTMQKQTRDDKIRAKVDEMRAGKTQPIDHKAEYSDEAIEIIFQEDYVDGIDPEDGEQAIRQFFTDYPGAMPEQIKSTLRKANNADLNSMIAAAELVGVIEEVGPASMDQLPESDMADINYFVDGMNLGINPVAIQENLAKLKGRTPEQLQAAKAVVADRKTFTDENAGAFDDVIKDVTGRPWFGAFRDVPTKGKIDNSPAYNEARTHYDMLVRRWTPVLGDVQMARQAANREIKKQYQTTKINGDWQLMKYAPKTDKQISSYLGEGASIASDRITAMQIADGIEPTYAARRVLPEDYTFEPGDDWQAEFTKVSGMSPVSAGIDTAEEAASWLNSTRDAGNVLDLPRWSVPPKEPNVVAKDDTTRRNNEIKERDVYQARLQRELRLKSEQQAKARFHDDEKWLSDIAKGIKDTATAVATADTGSRPTATGIGF